MSTILITGGTGFLGSKLIEKLYTVIDTPIRVVARNEGKLIQLKNKFPSIEIVMGDIADSYIAHQAVQGIETVYHLAAFKHTVHAEIQTYECIKSNIIGTINLLASFNGRVFVSMSTDKAADMIGLYGCTKFLIEKLVQEYSRQYPDIRYRIVRCGNIMFSTGSVLELWRDALINKLPIKITDPNATRFFYTVEQAVDLVLGTAELNPSKSIQIGSLLVAMQSKYGKAVSIETIGLQKGEKLHEVLVQGGISSNKVKQYTFEELLEII